MDPDLAVQGSLHGLLGAPLIGHEQLTPVQARQERPGFVDRRQDPPERRAPRAIRAGRGGEDGAAGPHHVHRAGDALGRLVEVAVQGRAAVGGHHEVQGLGHGAAAVAGEHVAAGAVRQHRVAGEDAGGSQGAVDGDVHQEVGAGEGQGLQGHPVERVAVEATRAGARVGHHGGPVHHAHRGQARDAWQDGLAATREACPHVGLDEPGEQLEIRPRVAGVDLQGHAALDLSDGDQPFGFLGLVVRHRVALGDGTPQQRHPLLLCAGLVQARGDEDQGALPGDARGLEHRQDGGQQRGIGHSAGAVAHHHAGVATTPRQLPQRRARDRCCHGSEHRRVEVVEGGGGARGQHTLEAWGVGQVDAQGARAELEGDAVHRIIRSCPRRPPLCARSA